MELCSIFFHRGNIDYYNAVDDYDCAENTEITQQLYKYKRLSYEGPARPEHHEQEGEDTQPFLTTLRWQIQFGHPPLTYLSATA